VLKLRQSPFFFSRLFFFSVFSLLLRAFLFHLHRLHLWLYPLHRQHLSARTNSVERTCSLCRTAMYVRRNHRRWLTLDSLWRTSIAHVNDVVEVVAHGHEQVKEKFAATSFHLSLHGAAALEGLATANDEGEVMCSQAAV
jgi:hypothetical protein